jgi:hypothetical protein
MPQNKSNIQGISRLLILFLYIRVIIPCYYFMGAPVLSMQNDWMIDRMVALLIVPGTRCG